MRRPWDRPLRLPGLGLLVGLLGLTACHDSPRDNPLDPELTPAVRLTATGNDTTGTVVLSWTPYTGEVAFKEYRVLRNAVRSTVAETLFVSESPDSTLFVDRSRQPDTTYEYRVAVVNQAGLQTESARATVSGFAVQGVQLLTAAPDSLAGGVRLCWTRYVGPGFAGYCLLRRPSGGQEDTLARVASVADTAFMDSGAVHQVRYTYTVVTLAAGRQLLGNPLEARLELAWPAGLTARFDPGTATATLQWSRYSGPRFSSYQIIRQITTATGMSLSIADTLADPSVTSYTDPGLLGNTEYEYRVVATTERGEEVRSPAASGGIYMLSETWEVPEPSGPAWAPRSVRLYPEQSDGVTALVVRYDMPDYGVDRLLFAGDGRLLTTVVLKPGTMMFNWGAPAQLATAVPASGTGLLAYVVASGGTPMIRLEAAPEADVRTLWKGDSEVPSTVWLSLVPAGKTALFAADQRTYTIREDGTLVRGSDLPSRVGEIRTTSGSRDALRVGVCLPEINTLLLGDLPSGGDEDWAAYLTRKVLPRTGGPGKPLIFPLSFDFTPDGSLVILDAGHGRILVVNPRLQYVTEWGEPGTGPGQFSFGEASSVTGSADSGYAGSVAVDGSGNVYVAERRSGRIQKFTP